MNTESLKAFLRTHELKSFTKAALDLGLTQSALSQKIARLEDELETTLFVRKTEGISLTSAGEKLLTHARQQLQMEEEFLKDFLGNKNEFAGSIRIAGYSSVMRSLIIPELASTLRKHPNVQFEFSTHEMNELPLVLKQNKAEFIITDYFMSLPGVEEVQIGEEEYVLVESSKHPSDIFLDHDTEDNMTEAFLKFQGINLKYKRSFMGDVYGLIDGVALGLGKAVISKHLIEGDKRLKIIPTKKKYIRPIVLSYFKQTYYPKVFTLIRDAFYLRQRR